MSDRSAAQGNSPRVIKLGGSLFDLPDLGRRFWNWLDGESPAVDVVVAGGGQQADAVRRWDERHELGDEFCHDLCGRAMSVTARLARRILSVDERTAAWAVTLADVRRLAADASSGLIVLDAGEFLLNEEPRSPGATLPRSWDVTSDSIAARVAELLAARELVLLKSTDARPSDGDFRPVNWQRLSSEGVVDRHFPKIAPQVRAIRLVNLRAR